MQLPSNKVGLILVVVVLIVAGTITGNIFSDQFVGPANENERVATSISVERRTTDRSSVDQDGDGLFTWQESLYGSDPNNKDTDGDGTDDGDEIQEGRDPTIPGPDDGLTGYQDLFTTEVDFENYQPGSLTDTLSVELFANYLQLKQANAIDQQSVTALAEGIANQADVSTAISNVYSLSDIATVETTDQALNNYGVTFANLYIGYANALTSIGGQDDLEYIEEVASTYQAFAAAMARMKVPTVAANVHLEIVNKIHNAGVSVEQFAEHYELDPVKSLFAIQNIQLNAQNDFVLYNSLAVYFRDNGILFEDSDVIQFWNYFEG